jgi:hypothetical protein
VRIHKGGVVARNRFTGGFENNGVTARQGTIVVEWNIFAGVLYPFSLYNEGAPEPANLRFRNNTVAGDVFSVETSAGSTVELVNNIFYAISEISCSAAWNVSYNDFYLTPVSCSVDTGNIYDHPMYCNLDEFSLDPESPCVGTGENGMNMGAGAVCIPADVNGDLAPPINVGLRVSPNPVRSGSTFRIVSDVGARRLEIFTVDGRQVAWTNDREVLHSWTVFASRLWPEGVYFVRTHGDRGSEAAKFSVIP